MDEKQELECLRRELVQANYEYYVQDAPTMTDYDYDHKLRRLEELEAAHPEWITPDSPTRWVGESGVTSSGWTASSSSRRRILWSKS